MNVKIFFLFFVAAYDYKVQRCLFLNLAYIYCIIYYVRFSCLSYVKASAKQKLGSMFKYVVIILLVSVLFQLKREISVERASN